MVATLDLALMAGGASAPLLCMIDWQIASLFCVTTAAINTSDILVNIRI